MNTHINMQISAQLNNLGVARLERNDLSGAMHLFRTAIRYTVDGLHVDEMAQQDSFSRLKQANVAIDSEYSRIINESINFASVQELSEANPSPTLIPFVHTWAFNILPMVIMYSPDPLLNITLASCFITFNMAIIYHVKGLENVSWMSQGRLHKARCLYHKCLMLLNDTGVDRAATGNAMVDMLTMCTYNNLAQCNYELEDYEESRHFFETLLQMSRTMFPQLYGESSIASLLQQQKSNFLLNAIVLRVPKFAPAA